ncbi:hypothetical protein C0995_005403, partial [Termitomyces sp. Mi166
MLQSTGATHAVLINNGTTVTFVSLELALPGKEIGKPIELQLFDGIPATSGLITHHHSDILSLANGLEFPVNLLVTQLHCAMLIILDWKSITMTFKTRDAQLTASFSLKARPALTIKGVVDEDFPEPTNSESIHQPILVDFKEKKSVSTLPNPPFPQANPIPSYATSLEQLSQPGDNTAQPQTNANTVPAPKTKLEDQILYEVISPKYHKYADMFSEGNAKELPPHR